MCSSRSGPEGIACGFFGSLMLRRDYTWLPADYSCPPATLSFRGSAHFDSADLRASGHDGFFLGSGSGMEGSQVLVASRRVSVSVSVSVLSPPTLGILPSPSLTLGDRKSTRLNSSHT